MKPEFTNKEAVSFLAVILSVIGFGVSVMCFANLTASPSECAVQAAIVENQEECEMLAQKLEGTTEGSYLHRDTHCYIPGCLGPKFLHWKRNED